MKCKECNSCLRVIRLDFENISMAYWYCYLCDSAFPINKSYRDKEVSKEKLEMLKEKYEKAYGKRL